MSKPKLVENGAMHLPVDGLSMLDTMMEHITDEVQAGVDPAQILETIHDAACFWLSNKDQAQEQVAESKRRLN